MFYKGRDTLKEKIAQQEKYGNAFRIPDAQGGLLYHYAGMDTVWKILESDSFLARNIRFSNDSEEYRLGEKIIREYTKDQFTEKDQQEKFNVKLQQKMEVFYMVCFCRSGDLLSQWRGYARDGASLGMDFLEEDDTPKRHTEIFTVLNNEKNRKDNRYKLNHEYVRFVEMPYQAFYVDCKTNRTDELENAIHSFDDEDARSDMLLHLIPFIKDIGFAEEAEYRILFDISDLGKTEAQNRKIISKKIQYTEKENRKLPNIAVEVGDGEKKDKEVTEIVLGTEIASRLIQRGLKKDEIDDIYAEIEKELGAVSGSPVCQRSKVKKCIYIGEGNNQEDIMACMEDIFQKYDFPIDCENGIKIWCRGHLPIREIIVGPGERKEKMKESLKYFMQNIYWLRYVDVKDSLIPLQN